MGRLKGTVRLNGLDGPRKREFDVPDNWESLTEAEQDAIWRPIKESLRDDSVSFSVDVPCLDSCEGCEYCE